MHAKHTDHCYGIGGSVFHSRWLFTCITPCYCYCSILSRSLMLLPLYEWFSLPLLVFSCIFFHPHLPVICYTCITLAVSTLQLSIYFVFYYPVCILLYLYPCLFLVVFVLPLHVYCCICVNLVCILLHLHYT